MKDGDPQGFVRAAQENTGILSSLLAWLDGERAKVMEQLAKTPDRDDIFRLQGEAEALRRVRAQLGQMVRPKAIVTDIKQGLGTR